jgi:hypothetical protein
VLLIGVTLSFGGVIAVSAMNHFNSTVGSASIGVSGAASSLGKDVSLVYGTIPNPGSGGCTAVYNGVREGTGFVLALYGYGSSQFTPTEVFDNGTLLTGNSFGTVTPGSVAVLSLSLSCAHPSGQTFLLVDAKGDEVQVGT